MFYGNGNGKKHFICKELQHKIILVHIGRINFFAFSQNWHEVENVLQDDRWLRKFLCIPSENKTNMPPGLS